MNKLRSQLRKYRIARKNGLTLEEYFSRLIKIINDRKIYRKINKIVNSDDDSIVETIHTKIIFNKIKKRYLDQLKSERNNDDDWAKQKMPKIIWWCWLQGEENAPTIAKICLNSLKKQLPDYEINILTWENISNYINLPKKIINKFNAGWISGAHFSDIVRLTILSKFGGIWVDSTCYCSDDNLVRVIEKHNMFFYKNIMTVNNEVIKMSNWLIASKKDNPYLSEVSKLLIDYYLSSNYTEDHFVCHILLSLFTEKYPEIWDEIPLYNNVDPHMMQYVLNKHYDQTLMNNIELRSSFHKLNRHIDLKSGNTFYKHLKEVNQ